jgi:hypothetical protein
MGIDIRAEAELEIGDVEDHERRHHKPRKLSRANSRPFSFVTDANTYDFLALGTPQVGEVWEVLEIAISPDDPFTPPVGSVLVYVGNAAPLNTNTEPPAFNRVTGVPVSLPNVLEKSRRSLILQPQEQCIIATKGLPANLNINVMFSFIIHDRETFYAKLEG